MTPADNGAYRGRSPNAAGSPDKSCLRFPGTALFALRAVSPRSHADAHP